jgi:hypothetical protein
MNKIAQTIQVSGKISTISQFRRAPYRANDGIVKFDGDSLWFNYPITPVVNNLMRFDSSYNIVGSRIWDDGSTLPVRISNRIYPLSPLSNAVLAVEGPNVTYGSTGSLFIYDRTTPANNYSWFVDVNTLQLLYNGTNTIYIGTDGRTRIGVGSSIASSNIPSRLQLKGNWSFSNSTPTRLGQLFNVDTTTITFSGATGIGDMAFNSFARGTLAATGVSNADTISTVSIHGAPFDGSNMTSAAKLALEVVSGKTHLGGGVSILNSPTGYGAYRLGVLNPDSTFGTVLASTFATQSALNDTASDIRSAITSAANISSGEYTPTLTAGTNLDGVTLISAHYYRTGNMCIVYISFTADPTATGFADFDVSLPFASEISNASEVIGSGSITGSTLVESVSVSGDVADNRAVVQFGATGTSTSAYFVSFSYKITPP